MTFIAAPLKAERMKTAYLFPGQGSQAVGMGRALADHFAAAKEVFQEVDETLGQHLFRLMTEGPESDLNLTENTQPAIFACSVAALRVAERELGVNVAREASCVAGHSLGEYAALVAASSLSVAEGARLLRIRGQAMQRAVPVGEGAMAALIGLDMDTVSAVCEEAASAGEVCEVANHNAQQQIVISGAAKAVERAMEAARAAGAKRAVALPVSAPFHCSLMQPAAEEMREALADAALADAQLPVIANVTAQPVQNAREIRDLLVRQVTGRVRWQETMVYLHTQGVAQVVECGHGKVLSGLCKRAMPDTRIWQLGAPEDVDALAKAA